MTVGPADSVVKDLVEKASALMHQAEGLKEVERMMVDAIKPDLQKPEIEHVLKDDLNRWQSKAAAEIMECIKNGFVPPRSGVAQRMERGWSDEEKKAYKNKSKQEKAEVRMRLSEIELKAMTTTAESVESWRVVDEEVGTYMSINKIITEEGGGDEDVEATARLVAKCQKMGYPWVVWNDGTERIDYLYVRKARREEFDRCWRELQQGEVAESTDKETPPAKATHPVPAQAAKTTPPKGDPADGAEKARKPPKPSAEASEAVVESKKAAAEQRKLLKKAADLKKEFFEVTGLVDSINNKIRTVSSWSSFSEPASMAMLRKAKEKMDATLAEDTFFSAFIQEETADVIGRPQFKESLDGHLQNFVDKFGNEVFRVRSEAAILNEQHAVRERLLRKRSHS